MKTQFKNYLVLFCITCFLIVSCSTSKLFEASRTGDTGKTSKILSKNVNIDKQNKLGQTSLIIASHNGNLEVVKMLVNKGADINIKDNLDNSALMHSLLQNYPSISMFLLDNNANIDSNNDNVSPLNVAADIGNYEITKKVIEMGADIQNRTISGETPIFNALYSKDRETIDYLLSKDVKIIDRNKEGTTTLMLAVKANRFDLVKKQIEKGMSVNDITKSGLSAMHFAVQEKNYEMIEFLISHNANINSKSKDGSTPIGEATDLGDIQIVKSLLDNGANINDKCENNYTPLMISVARSDLPMLEYLLKNNVDLSVFGSDSESPLSLAVMNEDTKIIGLLFNSGYQERFISEVDFLPLKIAVAKNRPQLISMLFNNEYHYSMANNGLTEINNSMVNDSLENRYSKILQSLTLAQNELDIHKKEYNQKIAKVAGKNALRFLGEVALGVATQSVGSYNYAYGSANYETNEFNRAMANVLKDRIDFISAKITEVQQKMSGLTN